MSKSNSDETKKQKSCIQFRTGDGVFLIFSIWKKHIVTISLNCYLETFIQNKQNLLFLYFCKIVQAYIQQPNWLLVQNCPNIHQIFEGGQVYIDAATWFWEPRPWKRPALHFLGKKCQENFYIFDQTMDRSMIPDVCHSQELIETQMIWLLLMKIPAQYF